MGETRSRTQLPMPQITEKAAGAQQAFQRGMEVGREYTELAVRRVAAWAEEHPGQMLLVGLAAGFVIGKLLLPKPRRRVEPEI